MTTARHSFFDPETKDKGKQNFSFIPWQIFHFSTNHNSERKAQYKDVKNANLLKWRLPQFVEFRTFHDWNLERTELEIHYLNIKLVWETFNNIELKLTLCLRQNVRKEFFVLLYLFSWFPPPSVVFHPEYIMFVQYNIETLNGRYSFYKNLSQR